MHAITCFERELCNAHSDRFHDLFVDSLGASTIANSIFSDDRRPRRHPRARVSQRRYPEVESGQQMANAGRPIAIFRFLLLDNCCFASRVSFSSVAFSSASVLSSSFTPSASPRPIPASRIFYSSSSVARKANSPLHVGTSRRLLAKTMRAVRTCFLISPPRN